MSIFPVLHTPRLYLREIVMADTPALLAIHTDTAAMQWYGSEPLTGIAQAEALVATYADWRQQSNPGTRWGIERIADERLIGTCGLFKWNRTGASCNISYELAADCRGHGFMNEGLAAAMTWGFSQMQLNRIEARIHPANLASIRLVRSLGFVQEGLLRQAGYWAGQYHDLLLFSLLRQDAVEVLPDLAPDSP
jgi:[ribosomal protein S5]-alanine N-acetyltransferase